MRHIDQKTESEKTLGRKLRKFREINRLSQNDVAAVLGISARQVSNIETGKRRLMTEEIVQLQDRYPGSSLVDLPSNVYGTLEKGGDRKGKAYDEETFFDRQQACIESGKVRNIWVISPEYLSVLHSDLAAEMWSRNLSQGVNYITVWCFNRASDRSLGRLIGHSTSSLTVQWILSGELRILPLVRTSAVFTSVRSILLLLRGGGDSVDFYRTLCQIASTENDLVIRGRHPSKPAVLLCDLLEYGLPADNTEAEELRGIFNFLIDFYTYDSATVIYEQPETFNLTNHLVVSEIKGVRSFDTSDSTARYLLRGAGTYVQFLSYLSLLRKGFALNV